MPEEQTQKGPFSSQILQPVILGIFVNFIIDRISTLDPVWHIFIAIILGIIYAGIYLARKRPKQVNISTQTVNINRTRIINSGSLSMDGTEVNIEDDSSLSANSINIDLGYLGSDKIRIYNSSLEANTVTLSSGFMYLKNYADIVASTSGTATADYIDFDKSNVISSNFELNGKGGEEKKFATELIKVRQEEIRKKTK